MVLYGETKLEFLRTVYPFKKGIASEDTFGRFFMLLDAKKFGECFIGWVRELMERTGKTIAIDGKIVRRAKSETHSALNVMSAWAHEQGLVLAQKEVGEGGSEIGTIPEILDMLDIKGCTITVDAIGCQKAITEKIVKRKGDYILGLKGNQKTLLESAIAVFEGEKKIRFEPTVFSEYETVEKAHGRLESRKYRSVSVQNLPIDVSGWKGIGSLLEVHSIREIKGKKSEEKRYYISSLESNAEILGKRVRGHWGIENGLHWVLDVVFNEDQSRIRMGHAAKNLAMIRRIAINIIKTDTSKGSIRGKRKKAGWDDLFMRSLIGFS